MPLEYDKRKIRHRREHRAAAITSITIAMIAATGRKFTGECNVFYRTIRL